LFNFQVDKTPERIYPEKYQDMFQIPGQHYIELGKLSGKFYSKTGTQLDLPREPQFEKINPINQANILPLLKSSYNRDFLR
jgi:hypothetical protein